MINPSEKNFTSQSVIVQILWDAGVKPNPNDWTNLDYNNYPKRSKNMALCDYIKIQEDYLKSNKPVSDRLWLERLKVPYDLAKYPDFPVRPENTTDDEYLVITTDYWAKRQKDRQMKRLGFNKKPKKPRQVQRHKPKNQQNSNPTFEAQETSDMSKSKSEEILTEDLAFDSFFSEQNFEKNVDESEMCNLNTPFEKIREFNPIPTSQQPLYEHHMTKSGRKRVKETFKCEVCDYSCSQKDFMKTHMETAHVEKKVFECKVCESCSRNDNLKTHLNFFLKGSDESQFEKKFDFKKDKKEVIIPKTYGVSSQKLPKMNENIQSNEIAQSDLDDFKIPKISQIDAKDKIRKCNLCN